MLSVNIGPLALPLGQILLLLAFVISLIVGAISGRKERVPVAGPLTDILLATMLAARIGFVIRYFEYYQNDLWGIIDIRDSGFDILSGLIGALAVLGWKLWRQPAIRRPLGSAAAAGLLTWGAVSLLVSLIENQSRAVPDSPLARLDSRPITLSEVADGKPMVVNLWASWCPPCIREMPVLEKAQQDNPGITFVFVNQGERRETIKRFLTQYDLSINNVLTDIRASMGRTTGSHALPTTLFYDAQGRQVDAHLGELSAASLMHNLERID
ncbi:TlpA family protein disulfide reductase [Marinobacter alexandrii]|uniref:TlpA disulfide reductase family protein n=1 Tax=Marinobacter alexandrii TaxID=2570351 RepID=UPI0020004065|nr:TlpA disulfide reductase family protein [Marinobacter alexandrii]MCK2147487.1 TlpA family protein disulfide reductase [Marinobacter alexandrii]